MHEMIRTTVLLALLMGFPGLVIGMILLGMLPTKRVVLATSSTVLGLGILVAERLVEVSFDMRAAALIVLLLVSLAPTVGFWVMFRREMAQDEQASKAEDEGETVEI